MTMEAKGRGWSGRGRGSGSGGCARWRWTMLGLCLCAAAVRTFTVDCDPDHADCDAAIRRLETAVTLPKPDEISTSLNFTISSTTVATTKVAVNDTDDRKLNRIENFVTPSNIDTTTEKNAISNEDNLPGPVVLQPTKGRALNFSLDELQSFANTIHNHSGHFKEEKTTSAKKNHQGDLSDVSLDGDDLELEKFGQERVMHKEFGNDFFSNIREGSIEHDVEHPLPHISCQENGINYQVGDNVERGCEERCTCGADGRWACSARCRSPYARRGRVRDPLCYEKPADDPCCAIFYCENENESVHEEGATCQQGNQTYAVGERWSIACESVCNCGPGSVVICKPRCPVLSPREHCVNVQDPKEPCCQVQLCDVSHDAHEADVANDTHADSNKMENEVSSSKNSAMLANIMESPQPIATSNTHPTIEPIISVDVLANKTVKINLVKSNSSITSNIQISTNGGESYEDIVLSQFNLLVNLPPGKVYSVRSTETKKVFKFLIPKEENIVTDLQKSNSTNMSEGCYYEGFHYQIGGEFSKGCSELCECTGLGKAECLPIECPSSVGLEVLNPNCIQWAPDPPTFEPHPPECCPRHMRCLSDGSCDYKGHKIPNWSEVPIELTGCDRRCFCESGTLDCQNICAPTPALPPPTLRCMPGVPPGLVPVPGDDCCKEWGCSAYGETEHIDNGTSQPTSSSITNTTIITHTPAHTTLTTHNSLPTTTFPHENSTYLITEITKPSHPTHNLNDMGPAIKHDPNTINNNSQRKVNANFTKQTYSYPGPFADPFHEPEFKNKFITEKVATNDKGEPYHKNTMKVGDTNLITIGGKENIVKSKPSLLPYPIISKTKETSTLVNEKEISINVNNKIKQINNFPPRSFSKNIQKSPNYLPNYSSVTSDIKQMYHNSDSKNRFIFKEDPSNIPIITNPSLKIKQNVYPIIPHSISEGRLPQSQSTTPNIEVLYQNQGTHNQPLGHSYVYDIHQSNPTLYPSAHIPNNIHADVHQHTPHDSVHIYTTDNEPFDLNELLKQIHFIEQSQNKNQLQPNIIKTDNGDWTDIRTQSTNSILHQGNPKFVMNKNNKLPPVPSFLPTLKPNANNVPEDNESIFDDDINRVQSPHDHKHSVLGLPPGINLPAGGSLDSQLLSVFGPPVMNDNSKLTVISLSSDSPTSLKLVFGLPPVLVGLKGQVDLRYTSSNDDDISNWQSQKFTPADVLATSRLEFRLGGLQPSTEYRVRAELLLERMSMRPTSAVYSVRTQDEVTVEAVKRVVDVQMGILEVNSTDALLAWRRFTPEEQQLIDGLQVRYRPIDGGVYSTSVLMHRSRTTASLSALKPATEYEASLLLVPPPGARVELHDERAIHFHTPPFVDIYNFSVIIETVDVGSESIALHWSGIPAPAERYVHVYRAAYICEGTSPSDSSKDVFKLAVRGDEAKIKVDGLRPGTRCRVWLELFLTNGRSKTSNVLDVMMKPADTSIHSNEVDGPLAVSGSGAESGRSGDYYGPLVTVSVLAALGAICSLLLLLALLRRHRPHSVPITPPNSNGYSVPSAPRTLPTLPPYENPAYKLELQQETMNL